MVKFSLYLGMADSFKRIAYDIRIFQMIAILAQKASTYSGSRSGLQCLVNFCLTKAKRLIGAEKLENISHQFAP